MVFQNYALYPHLSVADNIAFSLKLKKLPKKEISAKVKETAEILGLTDWLDRKPGQLSGGQRQRVAIARALVNSPELLLADEPTGALDTATGQEIGRLLQQLNAGGQTLVLVTHDPALADQYAARTVRIVDGQLAGAGVPA
jgi:putative ABC transport system ATP-binding protein